MKAYLALLAFVLCVAVVAMAQASASGTATQPATAPNAQTASSNSSNVTPPAPAYQNDSELQSQIENAIRNEPTLRNSHIAVNVLSESISLSGTVASGKDKQAAERIAQSFDGNRKMNDNLLITGQKLPNSEAANNNPPSRPPQQR